LKDVEPIALVMVLNDVMSMPKDELIEKVSKLKRIEKSTVERGLRNALDTKLVVEMPNMLLVSSEIRMRNDLNPAQVLAMCRIYALNAKNSNGESSLVEFTPYRYSDQAWTDKKWREVLVWECQLSNDKVLEKTLMDLTFPRLDRKEYLKRCHLALAILASGAFPTLEILGIIYRQIKGYEEKK
jgi:hypothetical protein